MIDLGTWVSEGYSVTGGAVDDHEHIDDLPRKKPSR